MTSVDDFQTFAFRRAPGKPLNLVLLPHEEVKVGDFIVLDRARGKVRLAREEDPKPWFRVPEGSKLTPEGYLEMPK